MFLSIYTKNKVNFLYLMNSTNCCYSYLYLIIVFNNNCGLILNASYGFNVRGYVREYLMLYIILYLDNYKDFGE
jgi:hypothetical protein